MELKISIVTCSDTRDLAQDEAGAALEELIEAQGWTVASHVVVRATSARLVMPSWRPPMSVTPMSCSPAAARGFRCAM